MKNILASKLKYGANESGFEYDENLPRYIRITDFGFDGKLSEEKKLSLPIHLAKDYLLKDGDILFARSGATVGKAYQFKIHLGNEKSYCYAGYLIKAEPDTTILISDFLNYYTQSGAFLNWKNSIFNKATIENIGADKYSELRVPIPPLSEQEAIATFLDEKCGKIEALLEIKAQQIEKLKELRQVKIHQAVTKGLDANVALIDSGIDWIGEIPNHWEVKKVKEIFNLIIEPAPKGNVYELLSVYTDIGVKPRKELEEKGNKASTTDGYWIVKKGDIIVNKLLAWMGAIGISNYDGVTSPAYDILRNKIPIIGLYYHNLFRMKSTSSELKRHSRGIMEMRLRLYFEKFGQILVPYPPVEEQEAIVAYLEEVTGKIDQAIAQKQNQIEKLKEYKQSLINDVVTGKVRVC